MNKLYILTGPPGVGKSTISEGLANNLPKSVLIEGDTVYNYFVGGRIEPWKEGAPLDLFWNNCIYLINSYLEKNYDVVFNYIISPEKFESLLETFKDYEVIFKVLLTDEKTIIKRDKERPLDCQMGKRSILLLKEFKESNYKEENLLDTSNLSINNVVEEILNNKFTTLKQKSRK